MDFATCPQESCRHLHLALFKTDCVGTNTYSAMTSKTAPVPSRLSVVFRFAVLSVGSSLFTAPSATQRVACGPQADSRPPEQHKYSGLEFHLATYMPGIHTQPRDAMEGEAHQPKDAPYGGFGPDLPCSPPLSHVSSRFEVDDRRTRGFPSSPEMGVPHCVG